MTPPLALLVVGVSGSGKSTVGRMLADRLRWSFLEGDDLHPPPNRAKMAAGVPLTDEDRRPWLHTIAGRIDEAVAARRPVVVTCSALKRAYRDYLLTGRPRTRLVYLKGSRELLRSRLAARHGHFFPAELLDSQFADLEEPTPDEDVWVVPVDRPPEAVVEAVVPLLGQAAAYATGEQWELRHGPHTAVVAQLGSALRHYSVGGRPVLAGFDAHTPITGGRGQLLVPWPNRVGGGRYTWNGLDLQLPLTEPTRSNAIHGLLRWTPWNLLEHGEDVVRAGTTLFPQPGYPFLLRITAEYRLGPGGLAVTVTATNLGETVAPYGAGQHPYLTVGTDLVDEAVLTVPARQWLRTDERGLPVAGEPVEGTSYDFRTARPIGDLALDTAFAGLDRDSSGRVAVRLAHPSGQHGVELWLGEGAEYVQVFTGDTLPEAERRRSVAVEAMSCPPDAFRSGTAVAALDPGSRHVLRWGLTPWGTST
ncbi:gluconokinase, GntK/IdnK-type [Streptomyces sp. NPDC002133]|uniref:gluconokinase, GntK/IdnK-type n=1 Tax=Streptomyces sp. NPDC002133 TaxID=3154409 RepID=UPI00332D46E9